MAGPRSAPLLDPLSIAKLQQGRVPLSWLSCGDCEPCGPVLLPGNNQDYGHLPQCPWCLVRKRGHRVPTLGFVWARLREHWPRWPEYFSRGLRVAASLDVDVASAHNQKSDPTHTDAFAPDDDSIGHIAEVARHPHDTLWIETELQHIHDPIRRAGLRQRYGEVYQRAFETESNEIRREGRARYAANGDLREQLSLAQQNNLRTYDGQY